MIIRKYLYRTNAYQIQLIRHVYITNSLNGSKKTKSFRFFFYLSKTNITRLVTISSALCNDNLWAIIIPQERNGYERFTDIKKKYIKSLPNFRHGPLGLSLHARAMAGVRVANFVRDQSN